MKLLKNLQFSLKGILFLFFITVIMFFAVNEVSAQTYWVQDASLCPATDEPNYPGQNCAPTNICGNISGTAQCYDTSTLNPPTSTTTETGTNNPGGSAGFWLDCFSNDGGSAPLCDNNGSWSCNYDTSCYSVNRTTECNDVSSACGSCQTGYQECDGSISDVDGCEVNTGVTSYPGEANAHYASDQSCTPECNSGFVDCNGDLGTGGDGCEIQSDVTSYPGEPNAVYNASCTPVCSGVYLDCDSDLGGSGSGCEISDGGACMVGALAGTYNGCFAGAGNCEIPKSYFETGTKSEYSSTNPLLWGTQHGGGALVELISQSASTTGGIFHIGNDGKVGIGTSSPSSMLTVGINTGSQFLVNDTGVVTAGTWNGDVVGVDFGGTGKSSWGIGSMLFASSTTEFAEIGKGANDTLLSIDSSGNYVWLSKAQAGQTRSNEEIEDVAGQLIASSSGTHTLITVTYNDASSNVDLIVDGNLSNYTNDANFITLASLSASTTQGLAYNNLTGEFYILPSYGIPLTASSTEWAQAYGWGDHSTQNYFDKDTDVLAIANGGTGSTTALGARLSLGLGSLATQASDAVTITGGSITGITDLTVADGGTGRSSWTQYAIPYMTDVTTFGEIGIGASSTILQVNSSGDGYTWVNASGVGVDTTRSDEEIEDLAGGLAIDADSIQTLITVSYNDASSSMNYVVNSDLSQYDNSSTNFIGSAALSSQITAITLSTTTTSGIFTLTAGYIIPTTASTTLWNNTYDLVNASSSNWDLTHARVDSDYADWNSASIITLASSTGWQNTFDLVSASSSNWTTAFNWGDHSIQNYFDIDTDVLAIANGGTGSSTATGARTELGLEIGTNVQAFDTDLLTYAGISPSVDIQTFLGSVDNATARTNLGLGSMAIQDSASVSITGGLITGIIDIAVADGGTGRSSWTQNALIYASSSSELGEINIGTGGYLLAVNSGATGYEWVDVSTVGSKLTQEEVEDYSGVLMATTTGIHTLITVTYDDINNNMDFVVENDLSQYNNTTTAFIDYTDLSSGTSGLDYNNITGVFTINGSYLLPLSASTTNWNTAYNWGDHSIQNYFDLDGLALAIAEGGTGSTSLDNLITLGTHTTGNYLANATGTGSIIVTGILGEGVTRVIDVLDDSISPTELNVSGNGSDTNILTSDGVGGFTWVAQGTVGVDTVLSQEQVEDYAGPLMATTTGTHTLITVAYNDNAGALGSMDFTVENDLSLYDNSTSSFFSTISDILDVVNGGTGLNTLTQNALIYASSTSEFAELGIGASSTILQVNATGNGYEWVSAGSVGVDTVLSQEEVEDYAGALMATSSPYALIQISYNDALNTMTFNVTSDLSQYDNSTSSFITLGALSSTAVGLDYNSGSGVFSLATGYEIPTTVNTGNWTSAYNTVSASSSSWTTAFNWGDHSTQNYFDIDTDVLAIANGGTGSSTAAGARTELGLEIGLNVQAYDADLVIYAGISPSTDIQTFLGSADNATARTNLGLNSMAIQDAASVAITGGLITGITDITVADGGTGRSSWTQYAIPYMTNSTTFGEIGIGASTTILQVNSSGDGYTWVSAGAVGVDTVRSDEEIEDLAGGLAIDADSIQTLISVTYNDASSSMNFVVDDNLANYDNSASLFFSTTTDILGISYGGTGSSTALGARANLGLVIGTDVQGYNVNLATIAGLAHNTDYFMISDGANWTTQSTSSVRSTLGLGTIVTQNSNSVTITGGSITGITDLAVADGGTGRSSWTQYAIPYMTDTTTFGEIGIGASTTILRVNSAGTGYEWVASGAVGTDTTLSQEQVEDYSGNMVARATGNHSLITITYDDANGDMDFIVSDDLSLYDNGTSSFITLNDLSSSIAAITYSTSTGIFALDGSYIIPTISSTTDYDTAYNWGDHSIQNYFDTDTDVLAIANGGTGSSTAVGARTELGLAIGADVQAWNNNLDDIVALTHGSDLFMVSNGTDWTTQSSSTVRTTLGLANVFNNSDYAINSAGNNGEVWLSDGAGVGGWAATNTLGLVGLDVINSLNSGYVPYYDGTNFADSELTYNGTSVGIGTTTGSGIFDIASSTTGDSFFHVSENGNIGIGTDNPNNMLELFGASNGVRFAYDSGNYTDVRQNMWGNLLVDNNAHISGWLRVDGNVINFEGSDSNAKTVLSWSGNDTFLSAPGSSGTGGNLIFRASSTNSEIMRISSDGNVGIGTTSPAYNFDIFGTENTYLANMHNTSASSSAGGLMIRSDGDGPLLNLNYQGTDVFTVTGAETTFNNPVNFANVGDVSLAQDLIFTNNTAANINFEGPGYLRTLSGWEDLDLTLSAANLGDVVIDDSLVVTGTSTIADLIYANFTDAKVGIGTSSPVDKFSVTGNTYLDGALTLTGTAQLTTTTMSVWNNVIVVDGVNYSSDGAGIQSAINALPASGGKVFIPAGTYNMTGTTTIPSNVWIEGAGASSTILYLANGANTPVLANEDSSGGNSYIKISNLKIDGNDAGNTGANNNGIHFDNVDYSLVENIYVYDAEDSGIIFNDSAYNKIINSTLDSNGRGVYINGTPADNNMVSNNLIINNGSGVYVNAYADATIISNNKIVDNTSNGINLGFGSPVSNNLVIGNELHNNTGSGGDDNILVYGDDNMIVNNIITDNAGTGYAIQISNSSSDRTVISGNTYSGTGATAIDDGGTNTIFQQANRTAIASNDTDYGGAITALTVTQSGTGDILNLYDGASEVFTILDGGFAGFGTSTPLSELSVYGDIFLEGTDRYINFGTGIGTTSYGFRDNAGTMEFKNSAGDWVAVGSAGSSGSLGSLSDITITSATEGDLIMYSGGSWINTATSTLGLASDDIYQSLNTNYVSKWNGTAFADSVLYDNGTNVGIGTTTASSLLTVGATSSSQFLVNNIGQVTDGEWLGDTIGLAYGGTGNTAFTSGSIVFSDGSILTQDNSNFFWDDTNKRLGLGTSSPSAQLEIFGINNELKLSYDVNNYASLSVDSQGQLSITGSNVAGNDGIVIGTGLAQDTVIELDGNVIDYYLALDDSDDTFKIGTGATVGSNTALSVNTSGYVGIGTSSPSALLSVGATSSQQFLVNTLGVIADGTWNGNIIGIAYGGIATSTAPTTGQLLLGNASGGYNLVATSTLGLMGDANVSGLTNNYISKWNGSAFANSLLFDNGTNVGIGTSTSNATFAIASSTGASLFHVAQNGNVGVGTDSPLATLHLDGTNTSLRIEDDNLPTLDFYDDSTREAYIQTNGADMYVRSLTGDLYLGSSAGAGILTIDTSGLVGIGTSSPSAKLTVQGDGTGTGRLFNLIDSASTTVLTVLDNGNFGVGTDSPDYLIDAVDSSAPYQLRLGYGANKNTLLGTNSSGDTSILGNNNGNINEIFMYNQGTSGYMSFSSDGNEVLRMFPTGNIGIGTTTASSMLTVGATTSSQFLVNNIGQVTDGEWLGDTIALGYGGTGNTAFSNGSIVFSDGSILTEDNTNFFWDDTSNYLGLGTSSPRSQLEIFNDTTDSVLTITSANGTNDPLIKFLTGTSSTAKFTMGVDASDSNKFKITQGDSVSGADVFVIDEYGQTTITNLQLGAQVFAADSGAITWTDMAVTSGVPSGTEQSLSALIDGQTMLVLYSESDGLGGIQNKRIGIGTSSPQSMLTVYGDVLFEGTDRYLNFGVATSSAGYGIRDNAGTIQIRHTDGSWTDVGAGSVTSGTAGYIPYFATTGTTLTATSTIFLTDGKVGIGTTTPTGIFDIASSTGDSLFHIAENGNIGIGTNSPNSILSVVNNTTALTWDEVTGVKIDVTGASDGIAFLVNTNSSPIFSVSNNGEVGIGTNNPGAKLSVQGAVTIGANFNSGAPTNGLLVEGNVGIGTTTANSQLTVGATTTDQFLVNNIGQITDGTWMGDTIGLGYGGTGNTSFTSGSIVFSNGTILTEDNSNFFWDDTNNRLGIGTSTPDLFTLQVAGNIGPDINNAYSLGGVETMSMDTELGTSSDASFWGENASDLSGVSVSGIGDINGDGYDDFAIGAYQNSESGSATGQTYVIFGKASGWSMDTNLSLADASFWGENVDDQSGNLVSGIGDINGDGYDDFAIGAYGNDESGSAAGQTYIIFGKSSGWSMDTELGTSSDASFWGENAGDQSGNSVSGIGDVNGDGYDDFAIGANQNDAGGSGAGQTYIIFGKASGWSMDTELGTSSDASFWGENSSDYSGNLVSGIGDVNGDGYDDFAIGANQNDAGGSNAGQTYIIFGKASGWSMDTELGTSSDASFWGEDAGDESGISVSGIGDVNGDGYDDFAIGAPADGFSGLSAGQTYIIFGKASGWSMDTELGTSSDASFWGENVDDNSGNSVSGIGDINGDGYDDFAVGTPTNDAGGSDAGQTYIIFGKASGWSMDTELGTSSDASFWGENSSDYSGVSVSGIGDVNGDGYDDFAIGAYANSEAGSYAGQTYVILGKPRQFDSLKARHVKAGDSLAIGDNIFINGETITADSQLFIDANMLNVNGGLTTTGNVGIGTTSPSAMLTVGATTNSQFLVNSSGQVTGGTWMGDVIGLGYGGTGTSTSFTAGSILFADGTSLAQDNSNFFWDDTNSRLGIGTSSPLSKLHINGGVGSLSTGLTFGDGNTGFYENVNDNLYTMVGGLVSMALTNVNLYAPTNVYSLNDINTGLSWPGSDVLTFSTGGNESLRINASGYLAIGTTTANAMLTIGATSTDQFLVNNIGQITDGTWQGDTIGLGYGGTGNTAFTSGSIVFSNGTILTQDNSNFFWDDTNNRLGIGTSTPSYLLDITASSTDSYLTSIYNSGTASTSGGLYVRSDGEGALLNLNYAGTDVLTITGAQTTFNNPVTFGSAGDVSYAYDLVMDNGTASYIKFMNSGYIQTDSPFENLDLTLSAANLGDVVIDDTFVVTGTTSIADLLYINNNTGNIGIGTTTPGSILSVGATSSSQFLVNNVGQITDGEWLGDVIALGYGGTGTSTVFSSGSILFSDGTSLAQNNSNFFWDNTNSRLGIGTTTPTNTLTVSGLFNVAGTGTSTISDNLEVLGTLKVGTGSTYIDTNSITFTGASSIISNSGDITITPASGNLVVEGDVISAGTVWATSSVSELNVWSSVAYGNGVFVAISDSGNTMRSSDGITWATSSAVEITNWRDITFGDGLFVAIAGSGTNRVMTSPDGITWTGNTGTAESDWRSVTYGNGLFVAVSSSATNSVMISPDGVNWTANAGISQKDWRSVTYGNGLFVAVSATTSLSSIMTSPDGVNWTLRSATEGNDWSSVVYGNGLFVAVAQSGIHRVMISSDGLTWTARSAAEANGWASITYGNGLFVALSGDGANRVMISSDGLTWTARSASEANGWASITYGNGTFVALSYDGTNRVMTSGKQQSIQLAQNNTYQGGMNIFGNVGIGTSTPTGILEVASSTGDSLFHVAENGNIGIGTTIPGANLHIRNNDSVTGLLIEGYASDSDPRIGIATEANTWLMGINDGVGDNLVFNTISGTTIGTPTSMNSPLFVLATDGNIGIGDLSPDSNLEISANGSTSGNLFTLSSDDDLDGDLLTFTKNGYLAIGTSTPSYFLDITASSSDSYLASIYNSGTATTSGGLYVRSDGEGALLNLNYNGTDVLTVTGADTTFNNPVNFASVGDVSFANDLIMTNDTAAYVKFNSAGYIQTNSAWQNLDLTLSAANLGDVVVDDSFITTGTSTLADLLYVNYSDGKIGIGTSSPTSMLSIKTSDGVNAFHIASSTGETYLMVQENGNIGIGTSTPGVLFDIYSANPAASDIVFSISTSTGIGMKISADGEIISDKAFNSSGADYAEYFYTVDTDLEPGEVVCVDITNDNAVARCYRESDGNVMGIVSSNPSIVGNAKDEFIDNDNYVVIGMLGQVPARVTDENGAVRPGDSLTSASLAGYLMKASSSAPTVGVALESLDSGIGNINVLIARKNKSITVEEVEEKVTERIAAMEIEDEVNILIATAVDALNLDENIKTIVDDQLLLVDARLTIEVDTLSGLINNNKSDINNLMSRVTLVENDILDIKTRLDMLGSGTTSSILNSNTFVINEDGTIRLGNNINNNISTTSIGTSTVEIVDAPVAIVDIEADSELTAFVVNQVGNGDVADFQSDGVSIVNIAREGSVRVVGEMLVDGRIMLCSGGSCGTALDEAVDETMGDMGVEGKVVAGAFENYCADGFVWVEGSAKYGTMPGFCVMADEAKFADMNGDGIAEMDMLVDLQGPTWDNMTQGEAKLTCESLGSGYHLISENEWMTIADSIIKVAENDMNDELEGLQLISSSTATSTFQLLANGNEIFSIGDGLGEWTDKIVTKAGVPTPLTNDWQEYFAVEDYKGFNIIPPYFYSSENGIGMIKTGDNESAMRGFVRGTNGVFSLDISNSPIVATSTIGFRCAK